MQQQHEPNARQTLFLGAVCMALCSACSTSSSADGRDNAADATNSAAGDSESANAAGDTSGVTEGSSGAGGDAGNAGGTSNTAGGEAGNADDTGSAGGAAGDSGDCSVVVESHTPDRGIHVTECSHIDYSTNPPSSGEHYEVWAAYHTYDFPLPRGYWVHGLEHGAVVITYNCPDGCADQVAQAQAFIDAVPADPRCAGTSSLRQIIMTPDPLLDTRWGLSSWGYTLRADCVDTAAFEQFYADHLGHGPEDTCGDGLDLTQATLMPDCGQ